MESFDISNYSYLVNYSFKNLIFFGMPRDDVLALMDKLSYYNLHLKKMCVEKSSLIEDLYISSDVLNILYGGILNSGEKKPIFKVSDLIELSISDLLLYDKMTNEFINQIIDALTVYNFKLKSYNDDLIKLKELYLRQNELLRLLDENFCEIRRLKEKQYLKIRIRHKI